jgi:nifR3 family TIM-barrel protein
MITLGRLQIEGTRVLAPIAGYTDSPCRRISRRHGAALVFTELISVEGIVRRNANTFSLMRFTDEERPIGIQIFGKDAAMMAEAARIVDGELRPDCIDINMGCCAQKVCAHGSGAALLRDPGLVASIAGGVVKASTVPVSAKIRIGWDEQTRTSRDVVRALEDSGVSFITVHGRTKNQKYTGHADWGAITDVAGFARVPVIGNGDITTFEAADERLRSSGCAAVMIGRGAIGNPWIFSGRTPDARELVDQMTEHVDLMLGLYGEYGLVLARKHMVKYIHGMRGASAARERLVRAASRAQLIDILEAFVAAASSSPDQKLI